MPAEHVGNAGSPSAATRPAAIELRGIDKSFGAVHANKNVNLTIAKGSIHGIIGENGAGKSTLMSILYGFYTADSGEILINGNPVKIHGSHDAIAAGIGMVHQHFMLVEPFTVLENVMLGAEGGALLRAGAGKARAELITAGARLRPQRRCQRAHLRPAGRRAAARRDPEGAVPPLRHPDPGRADRRADAAGDRSAVPDPARPQRARRHHRPHHPQAARDPGHHRHRLGHARRRDGGDPADQAGDPRAAGGADGRAQGPPGARQDQGQAGRRAARGARPDRRRRQGRDARRQGRLRSARRRDPRHRRRLRQRPERAAGGAVRHPPAVEPAASSCATSTVSSNDPRGPAEVREHGMAHVPEDRLRLGVVTSFPAWESCVLGYHDDDELQRPHPDGPRGDDQRLRQADGALRRAAAQSGAASAATSPAATSRS